MESERFVDKEKRCVGGRGQVRRGAGTHGIESERGVDKRWKKKIVKSRQV